jgi:hypothetical protein
MQSGKLRLTGEVLADIYLKNLTGMMAKSKH